MVVHTPTALRVRPTADTRLLIGAAVRALEGMYRLDFNYVKADVMLVDLQPNRQAQGELDLFCGADVDGALKPRWDHTQLMGALDELNRRFGRDGISVASAARNSSGDARYAAKQQRRSPRYTTRLDETPTAVA